MNIMQAKNEIKNTVLIYLKKDKAGDYLIPIQRQRPVFLLGAPGIGKTEIIGQVCAELKIGFINYTITHHTRQSAIGLPSINIKSYNGESFNITNYTMSEIIAEVYEAIEKQGYKEGILFIDEINCVSESLAPAMLDLLQNKKFGPHRIPSGWVLVTAGNPSEYNKSAREFDMVTADRIKLIEVESDFETWKKYAYKNLFSEDILSYLSYKPSSLFKSEKSSEGLHFVTPRGWEDLSIALKNYNEENLEVNFDLIIQYVQHPEIARDFYRYYLIYKKYKQEYDINLILSGKFKQEISRFKKAKFDEKLAIIEVLLSAINQKAKTNLNIFDANRYLKIFLKSLNDSNYSLAANKEIERLKTENKTKNITTDENIINKIVINILEKFTVLNDFNEINNQIKELAEKNLKEIDNIGDYIKNSLNFVNQSLGEGQEMVAILVNILTSENIVRVLSMVKVTEFNDLNSRLLIDRKSAEIIKDINVYESKK